MKKILLYPIAIVIISCCGSKKSIASKENQNTMKIENACPENVNCTFEIIPNKSLEIKTDDIGKIYYELTDNPEKVVFQYQYDLKVGDDTLQDAGYKEEVIFEMDKNYADFSYSGKQLQETKMLFGVMCFCRGKAGHYKVTSGDLTKKGNQLSIDLPELIDSQKVRSIKIRL